jgi:ATP adenylyltransferase
MCNLKKCCFCSPKKDNIVFEDAFCFVYRDQFPVSDGHSLIIPKRHFDNFFDATFVEIESIWNLLKLRKDQILKMDSSVSGFNIGINIGISAGQSIFHLHVHLIPRRNGDVENPRGGIRGVLPIKMNY